MPVKVVHRTGLPEGCFETQIGTVKRCRVMAITDAAGPQVVVRGKKVHLISRPLADHNAAVELGKQVVERGIASYDGWMDANDVNMNMFALFGGPFRSQPMNDPLRAAIREAGPGGR